MLPMWMGLKLRVKEIEMFHEGIFKNLYLNNAFENTFQKFLLDYREISLNLVYY